MTSAAPVAQAAPAPATVAPVPATQVLFGADPVKLAAGISENQQAVDRLVDNLFSRVAGLARSGQLSADDEALLYSYIYELALGDLVGEGTTSGKGTAELLRVIRLSNQCSDDRPFMMCMLRLAVERVGGELRYTAPSLGSPSLLVLNCGSFSSLDASSHPLFFTLMCSFSN